MSNVGMSHIKVDERVGGPIAKVVVSNQRSYTFHPVIEQRQIMVQRHRVLA